MIVRTSICSDYAVLLCQKYFDGKEYHFNLQKILIGKLSTARNRVPSYALMIHYTHNNSSHDSVNCKPLAVSKHCCRCSCFVFYITKQLDNWRK